MGEKGAGIGIVWIQSKLSNEGRRAADMKRILILLLLLLPLTSYAVEVGDKAPDFKVASLDGKRISYYSDFKGNKPVYRIFWPTW